MALYYQPQDNGSGSGGGISQRHRSQSDSNLLSSSAGDNMADSTSSQGSNGATGNSSGGGMVRVGSMGTLTTHSGKDHKKKGFFHRLVRPWKWKKRKRSHKDRGRWYMYKICG